MQNFYSSHEFFVLLSIEKIAVPLMKFIFLNINNKEVSRSAERLFESICSFSDKIVVSILEKISTDIESKN